MPKLRASSLAPLLLLKSFPVVAPITCIILPPIAPRLIFEPPRILGIDDRTGSVEAGKDANIVISSGDILDIRTSNIEHAFIQGREVSLDNKQTQLYHRYMTKYGLSEAPIP